MAKRNGLPLDVSWIHADATHNRIQQLLDNAEAWMAQKVPEASIGIYYNLDQTEVVVKVADAEAFTGNLPGLVRNAIIRTYTEAEHDLVLAMVTDIAWTGPQPEA